MKFLDLFSGIGGFRLGMEMAGHECIGYVEIDKFARRSYKAIFDTSDEWTKTDIREVTDDEWKVLRGTVDVICGGFPCQPFSIAGNRRGFSDTRGTMFSRLQGQHVKSNPKFFFLKTSNIYSLTTTVKRLKSSSKRWMNWGMMQNGKCVTAQITEFPKTGNGCSLSDILEDHVDRKYFLSPNTAKILIQAERVRQHLLQDTQEISVKVHILSKRGSKLTQT